MEKSYASTGESRLSWSGTKKLSTLLIGTLLLFFCPVQNSWAEEHVITIYFGGTGLVEKGYLPGNHTRWGTPSLMAELHENHAWHPNNYSIFIPGVGAGEQSAGQPYPEDHCTGDPNPGIFPLFGPDSLIGSDSFNQQKKAHEPICRNWLFTVEEAIDKYQKEIDKLDLETDTVILNLVGHSRGAIAAIWFLHKLFNTYQSHVGDWLSKTNLIALDPVPGMGQLWKVHDYDDVETIGWDIFRLDEKLTKLVLIYANDERSNKFSPILPWVKGDPETLMFRVRGSHQTMVGNLYKGGHAPQSFPKMCSDPTADACDGIVQYDGLKVIHDLVGMTVVELLSGPEWGGVDFTSRDELINGIYPDGLDRASRKSQFIGKTHTMTTDTTLLGYYSWMRRTSFFPGIWPGYPLEQWIDNDCKRIINGQSNPKGLGNANYTRCMERVTETSHVKSLLNYKINDQSPRLVPPLGGAELTAPTAWNRIAVLAYGDDDGDGVSNRDDNCPSVFNPLQLPIDFDGDGVVYECDNCNFIPNPDQADSDSDGVGDVCEVEPLTANGDVYTATEDTPLNEPAPGVLHNDFDLDGDPLTAVQDSPTSHGSLTLNPDGSFDYTPDADYCGLDSFVYHANDGSADSNTAPVLVDVFCVNDAPDFTVVNPSVDEDTGPHSNIAVTSGFDPGPPNESSQTVIACLLTNFSDLAAPDNVLTAAPVASVNGTDDGCVVAFDTELNQYGSVTFDLQIQDSGGTSPGVDLSPVKQVTITVDPVNDPPYVESVTAAAQTVQYSDDINTVTVLVRDIDSPFGDLSLAKTGEPPDLDVTFLVQTACAAWDSVYTGVGSECTWTLDGQVLVPGDVDYDIILTPSDDGGITDGLTGTHTLSVIPEDATVKLDDGNDVAVLGDDSGNIDPIVMYFTAWETNDVDPPFADTADLPPANANANANEDDFVTTSPFSVQGSMTLSAVGPGPGASVPCIKVGAGGSRPYGEWLTFECTFDPGIVGVNTYEVQAKVDGDAVDNRYFYGIDEDALVVYDPTLGFTTGGGWFYWPGTDIPEDECFEFDTTVCLVEHPCAGYPGDKTNFGYVMKYNKKGTNVQGSALVMRHTVEAVGDFCVDAGNYRVKSNALYGLALGEGANTGTFGWASFAGKSTYREPGGDNEGNHLFFIYTEDHGEQGCGQVPSDKFWVEVWDKDDKVVMQPSMGPNPSRGDAEDTQCGNIYVPHKTTGD